MTKKLKPVICALITASALGLYSLPCAADITAVKKNIKSGEEICVDGIDEKGTAFEGKTEGDAGKTSIFPAAGVVINLEKIGLNVRTKPWGTILGVLPNSAAVTVTGVSGQWYIIEYKGRTAYAYKTYIALNKKTAESEDEKTYINSEKTSFNTSGNLSGRISKPDDGITPESASRKMTAGKRISSFPDGPADADNSISQNKTADTGIANGNESSGADRTDGNEAAGEAGTIPGEKIFNEKIFDEKDSQISGNQKNGAAFMAATATMSRQAREEEIKKAILAGNTPSFLNKFKEIKVKKVLSDGKEHTISYFAAPDYLAVGNDSDYVRTPMSPVTAQQIADKLGCMLPTAKMVDDIYAQASTKLNPQPMSSGNYPNWQNRMMKSEFYTEHQKLVQSQTAKIGHKDGELAAGHKKDVIISNSLNAHPDRVIIYGWQMKGGKNIQPLSWIHENSYADYSHGVRLIKREMIVDGVKMDSAAVLKDPVLSALLSKEGAMKDIRAAR